MADRYADVIVIGGGVAGLAAADVLSAEGKSVILLEGRGRLGGRVETRHDPAWPLPIECGAEFIHGKPRETWEIVQGRGQSGFGSCCVYDVTDEHWVYTGGKLSRPKGFNEDVEKVLELVTKAGTGMGKKGDMSFDECMARAGKKIKPEAWRWARLFVEGFNAADAREVSCAWLAEAQKASEKIEGDRLFRVYAGYDRVVQFLNSGLGDSVQVELSTVVRQVTWGKEGVLVEAVGGDNAVPLERREFEAKRAIITVPVGVLQATDGPGAMVFEPALPKEKHEAIGRLRMGSVVKVVLRFGEAFWEPQVPELNFLHGPGEAFPTWWTTLPIRTPVITGWAGGPAAEALAGKSEGDILTIALGSLSKMLKVSRRKLDGLLRGAHICDWKSEPLSRGAYSYAAAGGAHAAKVLARPVEGTLYFAGEATHAGMSGTVAGAIASGRRVAAEVLGG